jgi:hypothetical protein
MTRAAKPPQLCGCNLVELTPTAPVHVEYLPTKDDGGNEPVPLRVGDVMGARLSELLGVSDGGDGKKPLARIECLSFDGCFIGAMRDTRDFIDHVVKHEGYV